MSDIRGLPQIFPREDGVSSRSEAAPVAPVQLARDFDTGVYPYQRLLAMAKSGQIKSRGPDIEADQFQPASFDLRLGTKAYRVRASFLPGRRDVMDRIKELDGLPAINLEDGAALEPKAVYLVPLYEVVELKSDEYGVANPKSSTGRLDVLTRLITDGAMEFDRIEKGYRGQLYLEIAPLTFSIIVRAGIRLNQVRIHRDRGNSGTLLRQQDTQALYSAGQLISSSGQLPPLREGVLVPVTVDLRGSRPGSIIGYKARKNTNKIDLSKIDYYNPKDFWYDIRSYDGRLNLDQNEFYILSTREDVGVPPSTAAEMVPYDSRSGEFRVHYAGFFDPGFGWVDGKASGSKAVLEVRSYGVPFTIEHGQTVGWLRYAPIVGQGAEKLYGSDGIKSNYQGQGLALAKYFKPWPHLDPVPTYDHPMLDWWGK